jgi:hypothetical protein
MLTTVGQPAPVEGLPAWPDLGAAFTVEQRNVGDLVALVGALEYPPLALKQSACRASLVVELELLGVPVGDVAHQLGLAPGDLAVGADGHDRESGDGQAQLVHVAAAQHAGVETHLVEDRRHRQRQVAVARQNGRAIGVGPGVDGPGVRAVAHFAITPQPFLLLLESAVQALQQAGRHLLVGAGACAPRGAELAVAGGDLGREPGGRGDVLDRGELAPQIDACASATLSLQRGRVDEQLVEQGGGQRAADVAVFVAGVVDDHRDHRRHAVAIEWPHQFERARHAEDPLGQPELAGGGQLVGPYRLDVGIDPGGIGIEVGLHLGGQVVVDLLSHVAHAGAARLEVDVEGGIAEHFGERAAGEAPRQVHHEIAVAGRHETEHEAQVALVVAVEVGDVGFGSDHVHGGAQPLETPPFGLLHLEQCVERSADVVVVAAAGGGERGHEGGGRAQLARQSHGSDGMPSPAATDKRIASSGPRGAVAPWRAPLRGNRLPAP